MRPNVLCTMGHGGLRHKEEFSTKRTWVKVLLLQNHFGTNTTHTETYWIQETSRYGVTATASASLAKLGPINPTDILHHVPEISMLQPAQTSLKQGNQETLLMLSCQTRPQSAPCFTPGGSGDEGQSFSCSLPSFAIQHFAWTLHCAQIYLAVQWNSPHS